MPKTVKKAYKFGWGKCQPKCLQRFHTAGWLCIVLCMLMFNQGFFSKGHFNAITPQLERRFYLKSEEVGIIDLMYEAGLLTMTLPVAHYGSFGHKGRWIGYLAIIAGIGSLVMAAPHFLTGTYAYGAPKDMYCNLNVTSSTGQPCQGYGLNVWKYMFFLGNFLIGAGVTPCWTLLVAYIDENVSQRTCGLYMCFLMACNLLGACIGYVFAGATLRIYGDFHKIDMSRLKLTVDDPRWYGAWYFGCIWTAMIYFILAPIILGYGRRLPGAEEARKNDVSQAHGEQSNDIVYTAEALADLRTLPRRVKLLLRNPTYVCLLAESVFSTCLEVELALFVAKYLDTQFSMPTSTAAFYAAASIMPSAVLGLLAGTFLVRQLKLRCNGYMITAALAVACASLALFMYFAHCPTVQFVPGNSRIPSCSGSCGCDLATYDPVCSKELNVTFFSKCHAGCLKPLKGKNVSDCMCNRNKPVIDGVCKVTCASAKVPLFIMGLSLMLFFLFFKRNPLEQCLLRCVHTDMRTLALCFANIPSRLLGSIPSGPIFGKLINRACLVWQEKCGEKQVCVIYNNVHLAESLMVAGAILIFMSFYSIIFAWCRYRPPSTGELKKEAKSNLLEDSAKSIIMR